MNGLPKLRRHIFLINFLWKESRNVSHLQNSIICFTEILLVFRNSLRFSWHRSSDDQIKIQFGIEWRSCYRWRLPKTRCYTFHSQSIDFKLLLHNLSLQILDLRLESYANATNEKYDSYIVKLKIINICHQHILKRKSCFNAQHYAVMVTYISLMKQSLQSLSSVLIDK